jgi:hypothetical protein
MQMLPAQKNKLGVSLVDQMSWLISLESNLPALQRNKTKHAPREEATLDHLVFFSSVVAPRL